VAALSLPSLSSPLAIAWDEANIYSTQSYVAYDPRNSVVKETWNGSSYVQSSIATNLGYPTALAVDGAGSVYVSDQDNYAVYKFTPTLNGSYTKTTVDNLGTVAGLAVDGAGNVYIGRGGIGVEKETPSGAGYLGTEIFYDFYGQSIAVNGNGVLYIADGTNLRKETPTSSGYAESILASSGVRDVKVDELGNVYYLTYGAYEIEKLTWTGSAYVASHIQPGQSNIADLATDGWGNILFSTYDSNRAGNIFLRTTINVPSLTFASTPYESTSSDSPKSVMIENAGNKALTFPVPGTGGNPSITPGFAVVPSGGTDCPSVDANSPSAGSLDAGQSCEFTVSFTPVSTGLITGNLTITSDSVTPLSPANATSIVPLSGTGLQAVPTISWSSPASITYGIPLGSAQLNATASTAGKFTYTPPAGTILDVGTHPLNVTFTPTDAPDYTTASSSVNITVTRATPSIAWTSPAPITYGTPLGSAQLNATSTTPGSFTYSPAALTVLNAGTQTLTVTFTPTDATRFATGGSTSTLVVNRAAPSVTVSSSTPSVVVSGAVTLNATVAFSYGTPTGSITFMDGSVNLGAGTLNAGVATLTTSSLAAGSHAITATYSGDSNFTPATSAAFTQSIFDFDFGPSKGASASTTVARGGAANYSLTVTPVSGQTVLFDVTFSAAGLPPAATATFTPATVTKGSGATDVKLTVSIPAATAQVSNGPFRLRAPFLIAFALLPLVGAARMRRAVRPRFLAGLLLCIGIAAGAAISGCGGGGGSSGGSTPPSQPQTYVVVLTASCGTLKHSTNLNLTVQ